ncbi:MAG: nuclear transport factor 2 family protein [Dehalococcoidia bacterium]|nr:nuclear transport factor 2 family protein [Dehalococcoidia bacterium]
MTSDSTRAVLEHHLKSIVATDVDAILEDYTDDSVLFTPDATVRGLGELRSFFTEFVKLLTPDFLANFKMEKQEVHDDTAYIVWTVRGAVPMGRDTLIVTSGKIRVQTVAVHMSQ